MLTEGYSSLWLACVTSGVLVPVPEDLPLVYAGTRVADGTWSWLPAVVTAFFGVGSRDLIAWTVGRFLGAVLLDEGRAQRWIGRRNVAWARRIVDRHGSLAVLLGRFLIGFRAPVFAVAGAMGVPFRAFLAYDGLGLLVAVPLAISLGFAFGHPIHSFLLHALEWCRTWLVPLGVAIAAVAVVWKWSVVRRDTAEEPQ